MARRVLDTSSAATAYLTKDNIEHPPTVSADITAAEVTARAELLLDLGATAPATNMTYLKLQHPGNLDAAPVPRARQRVLVTTCAEAAYLTKDNIEYPVPTFDAAALAKEAAARDIISIDVGARPARSPSRVRRSSASLALPDQNLLPLRAGGPLGRPTGRRSS